MRTRKVYWCMPVSHHRQTSKIKSASDFPNASDKQMAPGETFTSSALQGGRSRVTTEVPQHLRSPCKAIQIGGRCRLRLPMEASESKTIAILAEKPSVAQDIARVLGANVRGTGYLQGNGYVVTWAIGHLVSLAQPHEINPEWRQWRFDQLPILPTHWPLVVYEKTKDQFEVVRRILTSVQKARCKR